MKPKVPECGGKKAAEQLEKQNKDCNNTAGVQALLKVAVRARVMLRRNIDTKAGLVNGDQQHKSQSSSIMPQFHMTLSE